ncbi:MAG: S41 family peptidase [Anaerolineae bacterium]|nr:S41 family peptidase [Anaerolineae bacterium]
MRSKLLRFMGMFIGVMAIFAAGVFVGSGSSVATAQGDTTTKKLFEPFWEAWDDVHKLYVDMDKVSDDALMQGAISGMVNALGDKHSSYMDPTAYDEINSDLSGSYNGIGANVQKDLNSGGLRIVNTIPGSPAQEKLKRGDIIITVNGEDITALSESEIVGKVRGPAGTTVTFGIIREGEHKLIEIEVQRARINRPIVVADVYEGGIGYLKLNEFSANSTTEMEKALRQMKINTLNGLIFDLRDDPGGYLKQAIEIASAFIPSGTVVIQRDGDNEIKWPATGDVLVPERIPVVVLINEGSASASELVSGALQDYGRAIIVGTVSYGKGSVQSWVKLSNGGALRISSAHFFTPNDHAVHEIGITPDVVVNWPEEWQLKMPTFDPQVQAALWILRSKQ